MRLSVLPVTAALILFTGCSDEEIQRDRPWAPPRLEVPKQGVDPTIPAAPGEARAGRIKSSERGQGALFGGINAEGAAGDYKLYNSRVQFVIQDAVFSHGIVGTGGNVIDADLVRDDGTLGRDTLEDLAVGFGFARLFHADVVEILADGSAGGPAVVRSIGADVGWDFIQGLSEQPEPTVPDLHLAIENVYTLPADSHTLHISTTMVNTGEEAVSFVLQDGMLVSGEDMEPWASGTGFGGPQGESWPSFTYAGVQGEATLSMWPEQGRYERSPIAVIAAELGVALVDRPEITLEPGASAVVVRNLTVAPDTVTAEAARREAQGEALGVVEGAVLDEASGEGVAGARVHFTDDEGVIGFARTAADGTFSAVLPPGTWSSWVTGRADDEHVELPAGAGRTGPFAAAGLNEAQRAVLTGRDTATPLAFAAGYPDVQGETLDVVAGQTLSMTVELPSPGAVQVQILDGSGEPLPGVLDLQWAAGSPPATVVPEGLWEALRIPSSGRASWAWTASGSATIPAQAGDYRLSAGHSWRHGQASLDALTVTSGETTAVEITLEEVLERDGWLSLDPHLHGAPSFDGALPMEDRLVTCAATGVALPVTTDHDRQADYRPLASALGLDPHLQVIPGVEVSTILRGHFNVYPIEPQPLTAVNGGAEPWWLPPETTEALFDRMRGRAGPDALVQVNHPRSPGMFAMARYVPEEGGPRDPALWSWDFDTFELINGGHGDADRIREDWFSFLNLGFRVTPTGSSDSHYRYIPCGLHRTDVFVDETSPENISPERVVKAMMEGHVVVASGVTLRASLDDGVTEGLPGDTLVGGSATLAARVTAPDWIVPTVIRVYKNGVVIEEQAVAADSTDGVWFDGSWVVESDADAWFTVEVEGESALSTFWRDALPYAITNAFFLDVDGDGWAAPGLGG